ncbi:MAG: sialate O-acetylesterase [Ferruginibacter sp.]|nr:sialate O-acetylesterase [Ferruginibacter sp.]
MKRSATPFNYSEFLRLSLLVVFIVTSIIIAGTTLFANPIPASPFANHMVLQRNMEVPVWGTADAGEKVTVRFAKQVKSATADAAGKWMVRLGKLQAGGPFELLIQGNSAVKLEDVYVGEVWLCSGQSNMDMTVAREDRYWCGVYNEAAEVASANYPLIRVFDVEFAPSEEILGQVKGKWESCSHETVGHFSAAAYFFARELFQQYKVPIGLITTAYGASTAEAWVSKKTLEADPVYTNLLQEYERKKMIYDTSVIARSKYDADIQKWTKDAAVAASAKKDPPRSPRNPDPKKDQHSPYVMYNGMVYPLIPYAIRGALWYQGESNIPSKNIYDKIMETLVTSWRQEWGQGPFPFIYVQLANYGKKADSVPAQGGGTHEVRQKQLKNLSIPNTAMVVAIDNADDAKDIHPKNKQQIGHRLALAARGLVYKEKIVYSGPLYKSMKKGNGSILLSFDHVDGGLVAKDGSLKGFALAGKDKKFVWANAEIINETVRVSAPGITDPEAVRYAWGDNPPVNFYNKADLPAAPFRTDDW